MLGTSSAGDQIAGGLFVIAAVWAIVRLRRSNRSLRKYEILRQGLDKPDQPET